MASAAQLAESEKKRLDLEQRTRAWQEQTTRQFELAKQQNGALKGQLEVVRAELGDKAKALEEVRESGKRGE